MSLQHALIRARACVQRGQVDAAIKLYRGLLVSFAQHPQINADLGLLLLQHRSAQEAITYLNRAVAALPTAFEPWVCLVIAHQRCGDLVSAREVLLQMHAQGFDAARLALYEQELSEPTPEAVQALVKLIDSGNRISAEIAARMMVADYPGSETAKDFLARVIAMEATNVT
jgi:tetratricopeptide (TPR) repeat protein